MAQADDVLIKRIRERRQDLERKMDIEIRKYRSRIDSLKQAEEILREPEIPPEEPQTNEFKDLSIAESIRRVADIKPEVELSTRDLGNELIQRGVEGNPNNFLTVVSATANRLSDDRNPNSPLQRKKKRVGKKRIWVYKKRVTA